MQLKCSLLLSLKEIALRRVAVLLCNDSDILDSILHFLESRSRGSKEWKVVPKIKDKISKLELCESLTKELIAIFPYIGLEIRKWKDIQEAFSKSPQVKTDLAKLPWTVEGTIDYRKVAEELVSCDNLDVGIRYKIACWYCLEDSIPLIWAKLPDKKKEHYLYFIKSDDGLDLEYRWPQIIRGQLSDLDFLWTTSDKNLTSFNQWAFELSAENGNVTVCEYFFQKLTHEEKRVSLMRTSHFVTVDNSFSFLAARRIDILHFLLCLMTPGQRLEMVKARPVDVLLCFLDSTRPDLFMENADLIWSCLLPNYYEDLFQKLVGRFIASPYYSPRLFQKFLDLSPLSFKNYLVNGESLSNRSPVSIFLGMFLKSEDTQSIKLVFKNMDAAARVKLVFEEDILDLFHDCLHVDNLHLVEACLQEVVLTDEDMERLLGAFTGHLIYVPMDHFDQKWRWFLRCFAKIRPQKKDQD